MRNIMLSHTYYRPRYCILGRLKTLQGKLSGSLNVRSLSSYGPQRETKHQPYVITTPIFYVNSVPHIGHLYSSVLADVISRWKKLKQEQVLFSTGTDEHGLKIQQAAEKRELSPKQHCDDISSHFKALFSVGDVDYTEFVRTTEDRHRLAVQHFWRTLHARGHLHRGFYEGWYSTPDETFVTSDQVVTVKKDNGEEQEVYVESGHPVEWIKEDNYLFSLADFRDDLLHWLRGNVIWPATFMPIVERYIKEGLPQLSVSRPRSRLHWGIPVPDDDTQTIYVWLDALINYLTVCGYPDSSFIWPADCHVVGKDILKFHAVYWPAFLLAAGLEPPRKVLCHSHWMVNGTKMSKSLGNVVDPFSAVKKYSSDGVRYFLMREAVLHSDGNYQTERVVNVLNSELANTYGNLLSRCMSAKLNPCQQYPLVNEVIMRSRGRPQDLEMWQELRDLPGVVDEHYENFDVSKAVEAVMHQLRNTNGFMEYHKPWQLAKTPEEADWLYMILHVTMETLRVVSILLSPVLPKLSRDVLDKLQIPQDQRDFASACVPLDGNIDLSTSLIGLVFPRLPTP